MADTASDLFWNVFMVGGALVAECVCGRTGFATHNESEQDYAVGELDDLRAKANLHPEAYFEDPQNDSIAVASIGGVGIAFGCPCGTAARYERVFLEDALRIAEFLRKAAEQKKREAEAVLNAL